MVHGTGNTSTDLAMDLLLETDLLLSRKLLLIEQLIFTSTVP